MTTLTLAARNYLAQDTGLKNLLGRSPLWDTWIFDEDPLNVRVENKGTCLIVINEEDQWTSPNQHNTMKFPRLIFDVWADPTRNADRSKKLNDAKSKIEAIQKYLDKHFHRTDPATPEGMPLMLGTAEEIAAGTGVVITGSFRLSGPTFSPIRDTDGAFMGQFAYAINQP